jgi:hypothetical protein
MMHLRILETFKLVEQLRAKHYIEIVAKTLRDFS